MLCCSTSLFKSCCSVERRRRKWLFKRQKDWVGFGDVKRHCHLLPACYQIHPDPSRSMSSEKVSSLPPNPSVWDCLKEFGLTAVWLCNSKQLETTMGVYSEYIERTVLQTLCHQCLDTCLAQCFSLWGKDFGVTLNYYKSSMKVIIAGTGTSGFFPFSQLTTSFFFFGSRIEYDWILGSGDSNSLADVISCYFYLWFMTSFGNCWSRWDDQALILKASLPTGMKRILTPQTGGSESSTDRDGLRSNRHL